MKGLFAKIFLWFWATAGVLIALSVFMAMFFTGTPLIERWLSVMMGTYAKDAVHAYQNEGVAGASKYVESLRSSLGVEPKIVDANGTIIFGVDISSTEGKLLRQARDSNATICRGYLRWSCAAVVATDQGEYSVVATIPRPARIFRRLSPSSFVLRLVGAILLAGILCFLLTQHIVKPLAILQGAAKKVAAGDLSVRAAPLMGNRQDELVALAKEFDLMTARVESLLCSQQQMLGDISHELRSPLARLGVAYELVEQGDREALPRIEVEIRRINALIEQILVFTRLDLGEKRIERQGIDLHSLLTEVVNDANYEGQSRGIKVSLFMNDRTQIDGDPALLRSCVENVVRNALQHTTTGTTIEVSCKPDATQAVIVIRDHGQGVPPESVCRLFEPFFRVSTSRSARSGGRGLGLSISERAAALHGGSIVARNHPEGGLEVTITIPVRAA